MDEIEQLEKKLAESGFSERKDENRFLVFEKKLFEGCYRVAAVGPLNIFIFDDDGKSPISDVFIPAFDGTEPMLQFRRKNAFMFDFPFEDRDTEELMESYLTA